MYFYLNVNFDYTFEALPDIHCKIFGNFSWEVMPKFRGDGSFTFNLNFYPRQYFAAGYCSYF